MTCSDVRRVLPGIVDGEAGADFQAHLKDCPACSELVGDLRLIASEAGKLAEADEPPARVWVGIANQLRAEGIIRESNADPARPVLVPAPARRWKAWWLAPVAAAILAAGSYQLAHYKQSAPAPQEARQTATQPPAPTQQAVESKVESAIESKKDAAQMAGKASSPVNPTARVAENHNPPVRAMAKKSEPAEDEDTVAATGQNLQAETSLPPSAPASADDEQFLSEVSQRAPGMRLTFENQLRAVNAEIRETQEYIKRHPGDVDARQHLMEAYQQKAMLYQLALDRVQ